MDQVVEKFRKIMNNQAPPTEVGGLKINDVSDEVIQNEVKRRGLGELDRTQMRIVRHVAGSISRVSETVDIASNAEAAESE